MTLHFIPPSNANGTATASKTVIPKRARTFASLSNRAETRVMRAFGVSLNPFNYRYDSRGNVLAIDNAVIRVV